MRLAIIGGGVSGVALASGMSRKGLQNFCLFDSYLKKKAPLKNQIPLLGGLILNDRRFVERLSIRHGQRDVPYYRSLLFGGAGAINGCVAALGAQAQWNTLFDRYSDIAPFSMRIPEGYQVRASVKGPFDHILSEALNESGLNETNSLYHNNEGHGAINIIRGRVFRPNLTAMLDFDRVVNDPVVAINERHDCVEVITSKVSYKFDRVVISAGVLGTLKLLSTISSDYLGDNHIKDHPNFRLKVKLKESKISDNLNLIEKSLTKKISALAKYIFTETGVMQGTGASYVVYKDFDNDGVVDTKIQLLNFTESGRLKSGDEGNFFDDYTGISFAITLIKNGSSGVFNTLDNNITFKYLETRVERELMDKAVRFILNIIHNSSLKEYVDRVIDEDDFGTAYYKANVYSGYHLISGHNKNGIWRLGKNLSFGNSERIFVVDASAFENFTASNTVLPVALLAEHWLMSGLV